MTLDSILQDQLNKKSHIYQLEKNINKNFKNKTILLIGSSSGISKIIKKYLRSQKCKLYITSSKIRPDSIYLDLEYPNFKHLKKLPRLDFIIIMTGIMSINVDSLYQVNFFGIKEVLLYLKKHRKFKKM